MLVYFDESYGKNEWLFLGALFLPSEKPRRKLHQEFLELKKKNNFLDKRGNPKELKYSRITTSKKLYLAKEAIILFSRYDDVFFRACAMRYAKKELDMIGEQKGIPEKLKKAMIYTKATAQLIQNNVGKAKNGVLLMDKRNRATGDRFDQLIRYRLGAGDPPIFRHISYVDSSKESNQTIQICDLLLGATYNEFYPTGKGFKNEFREFVKKELKIPTFKKKYWGEKSQKEAEELHPKLTIRFWKNPYKKQTDRS